jgi:hypothetical protein
VPEDAVVEDRNLFVHASAQVHGDAEIAQRAHHLADFVRGASAWLLGGPGEDAHAHAACQCRA